MAVDATFLAKTKLELGVSYNNLDSVITDLIEEAILDLTATADIKSFTTSTADQLQQGAVILYVKWRWYGDDKYLTNYNDIKQKMALSGTYRSVVIDEE